MSNHRIGHSQREARAWEVWNTNYERGNGDRVCEYPKPWTVYRPGIDVTRGFRTHAEAITFIAEHGQ